MKNSKTHAQPRNKPFGKSNLGKTWKNRWKPKTPKEIQPNLGTSDGFSPKKPRARGLSSVPTPRRPRSRSRPGVPPVAFGGVFFLKREGVVWSVFCFVLRGFIEFQIFWMDFWRHCLNSIGDLGLCVNGFLQVRWITIGIYGGSCLGVFFFRLMFIDFLVFYSNFTGLLGICIRRVLRFSVSNGFQKGF